MKDNYFTEIKAKLVRDGYLEPHQRYGLRPTRKGAQTAAAHLNANDIAADAHTAYIEHQIDKGRTKEQAYLDATMFILIDMHRSNQLKRTSNCWCTRSKTGSSHSHNVTK